MENSNKKRSPNFTVEEEFLLVSLVKEQRHIIENKQTDTNITHLKNDTWINIQKEFNSQSGATFRSATVLRKKYENIKKRTKQKAADEKCYKFGTGGGPSMITNYTPVDSVIMDVLGESRVEGLATQFGGDSDMKKIEFIIEDQQETMEINEISLNELTSNDGTEAKEENNNGNWSKYTPNMLKKGKANKLKTKIIKEKEVTNKVSQWAELKAQTEKEKKEMLNEEQQVKLTLLREKQDAEVKILKEESRVKIEILKQESEIKINHMKEEQKLKVEILQLQKVQILNNLNVGNT